MGMIFLLALLQGATPAGDEQAFKSWIDALGSDKIEVRSNASKKLFEAGDAAVPYLKRGMELPDLELRSRCRELVFRIEIERHKVEPGARELADVGKSIPAMQLNPERKEVFDHLLAAGKIGEIVDKDYEWLTYAFDGILSDRKAVAYGSLQVVHEIIKKRAIPDLQSDLVSKPNLNVFYSAQLRATEYSIWAQWWFLASSRRFVAEWADESVTDRITDWSAALRLLRSEEGLREPDSRPSRLLKKIRSMDKKAYPILIRFLDDDDSAKAATALRLLQELTGRKSEASREKNRAALKAEWDAWWTSTK
jgi:hypothetical protein